MLLQKQNKTKKTTNQPNKQTKNKHKCHEVKKNKEKACKFTMMNPIWFVLIILFVTDNINYVQQNGDLNDPTSA